MNSLAGWGYPQKCFSPYLPRDRIQTVPTQFAIPTLESYDTAPFVGKRIYLFHDKSDVLEFHNTANQILSSTLAAWHKIDALKSFFYPVLSYKKIRTAQILKTPWYKLDNDLCAQLKDVLHQPERASKNYLFGHQKDDLIDVPLAGEDSDIAHIDGEFKLLLTSPDDIVRTCAWAELRQTVLNSTKREPVTSPDYYEYLSQSRKASNKISSHWSLARMASSSLKVKWTIHDNYTLSLIHAKKAITSRNKIFKTLHNTFKSERTR